NANTSEYTASFSLDLFYQDRFEQVYDKLSENLLQVEEYDDGYVKGKVYIPEGETLFTSIPYDEGWSIKVDGKKVEYYAIGEAFIGVDMEPGEHTVEFVYIPVGFKLGLLITIISLDLFILCVMHNSNKKSCAKLVKITDNDIDPEMKV
ncbi:MAG: YfhO family protein, partial [Wujia sp.]